MSITLGYHGSHYQFEKPDSAFFGHGDGRSVAGMGFYVAQERDYARAHLQERIRDGLGHDGGVIYQVSLNLSPERIFNTSESSHFDDIDSFIYAAEGISDHEVSAFLKRLKAHISKTDTDHFEGMYTGHDHGSIKNYRLQNVLENTFGQTRFNDVIKASGIDAIYTPNNEYSMYCVINLDVVGQNLELVETLGSGALRNNPERLLSQGELCSEELGLAYHSLRTSHDKDTQGAFERVCRILLSDKFNRRGLTQEDKPSATQQEGFHFRNHFGIATQMIVTDTTRAQGEVLIGRLCRDVEYHYGPEVPLAKALAIFRESLQGTSPSNMPKFP